MKKTKIFNNVIIIGLAIALMLGVTALQVYFGRGISLTLFYTFPVIMVSWKAEIWAGILVSFLSAIILIIADHAGLTVSSGNFISYLNNIFRLIIYLIITYIVSELKTSLEKQKELARSDALTSIANNRAFYETAEMEFNKAKRHGFPISVIYLDLDNFKAVNDSMGHSSGDMLLKLVSKTLTNSVRTVDLVARLGGDEFAILLSQTGTESAFVVAKKVREMILNIMENNKWPVTASIGIVTFYKPPGSVDEMIKKADELMYSAKTGGKNTIKHAVVN